MYLRQYLVRFNCDIDRLDIDSFVRACDVMDGFVRFTLCVDEKAGGKLGGCQVCKHLIQIWVGETLVGEVLVLHVTDEDALSLGPPGQVSA